MSMERKYEKNVPNWQPTKTDYLLVFRQVGGIWNEVSGNVQQYAGMTFAEYLSAMSIELPEGCVFCRVKRDVAVWDIREIGGIIRVFYKEKVIC